MAKVTFTIHKAGKHQRHSRRNQILDAAQRCFKKQGFHKTTLRDIAQEFGMSAGHIYNYFSNKEAIIEALVELRTQEFLDMIDTDKFADLPPEERMDKELGQVVDAYLNLDNTSLSIAIMNEALINPKVYEIVVAAASKVRNHIVEAQLLAMKEERRYAPPYEVIESRCMTIRAMLEGLRLAHIFTPEMDVPLVREMAIKRIKQIIALDEAEDQAAAAAEAVHAQVRNLAHQVGEPVRVNIEHGHAVFAARQTGVRVDDDRERAYLGQALHDRLHLLRAEAAVDAERVYAQTLKHGNDRVHRAAGQW